MATITRTYQQTLVINYATAIAALAAQAAPYQLGASVVPARLGPRQAGFSLNAGILAVAVNAGGSGYQVGDVLTSSLQSVGIRGGKLVVTSVNPGSGAITGVKLLDSGFGLGIANLLGNEVPSITWSGGHGTLATFTLTNMVPAPYGYPA